MKGERQDQRESKWMRAEFSLLLALLFFSIAAPLVLSWL